MPRKQKKIGLFHAGALDRVTIMANSFRPVRAGTHRNMPLKDLYQNVLCTCHDNLWSKHGMTMIDGLVDFTKGLATLCVINATEYNTVMQPG